MRHSPRYTSTTFVPHFLHILPDIYCTWPSRRWPHCLQPSSPHWGSPTQPMRHTVSFTCSSHQGNYHFWLRCSTTGLSTAGLKYGYSAKSIPSYQFLINLIVNHPPHSAKLKKNNAAKIISRGWHPSTASVRSCGSTIIKNRSTHCWITQEYKLDRDQAKAHDHASAEWARAHNTEPTPILHWPCASRRGADDTWSGWSCVQRYLIQHKVC